MKKPDGQQQASAHSTGCPDEALMKKYPRIVEYLVTTQWDDGSSRLTSSLAVSITDGMIQVALNDKELKQSFYSSAGSLPEAMGLLEKALAAGVDGWRVWKSGAKRK